MRKIVVNFSSVLASRTSFVKTVVNNDQTISCLLNETDGDERSSKIENYFDVRAVTFLYGEKETVALRSLVVKFVVPRKCERG